MARTRLPSLSALRAFEAASRRLSFTAAADELRVSPTAVSHQIRQLEDFLGQRVLNRSPRAVTLTAAGQLLYEATASGFGTIERAVEQLKHQSSRPPITLTSTTAFLGHWLVPRMAAARRATAVDLRLHASDIIETLRPGGIEVAIRYGAGPFDECVSASLYQDEMIAVCSPALGISETSDVRGATLIHVDRSRPSRGAGWPHWCAKAGLSDVDVNAGPRFPDSMLAVQAAIASQGIVIVSRPLVADLIAAGLLAAPFAITLEGDTYHFSCAIGLESRPDVAALREWFQEMLSV